MSSQLRVDKILPVDGAPTGGGGGIIQVFQASKTDTDSFSVATTAQHQYTTLTATITPKFNTSKILIMMHLSLCPTTSDVKIFWSGTLTACTLTDISRLKSRVVIPFLLIATRIP